MKTKPYARTKLLLAILALTVTTPSDSVAQPQLGLGSFGERHIVPLPSHPLHPNNRTNSLGWTTGYSAITTTSEQPNIFGRGLGGSDTIRETTTQIVPNDILGNPVRGLFNDPVPNSAGWNTGYSIVTSTYERPAPLGAPHTVSGRVSESTTRILPNDALGQPIRPLPGFWP
jgi:hypothetical protein